MARVRHANAKDWRDAVRKVGHEIIPRRDGTKCKRLDEAARCLWDAALAGDVQAMREVGNRLDGLPKQQVDVNASVSLADVFMEFLARGSSKPD